MRTPRYIRTSLGAALAISALPCAGVTLHEAVLRGDVAAVTQILAAGPKTTMATGPERVTMLHVAAALDHTAVAETLIRHGADVNARTEGGFSPLHWAARADAAETAFVLLSSGADVAAQTPEGITALHWAADRNATNVVGVLLNAGAPAEANTISGLTPLHWAVRREAEDAAIMIAFQIVSEQMARERELFEAESITDPLRSAPVSHSPPHAGRTLFGMPVRIRLAGREILEFTWIEALRLWAGTFEVTNGQFRKYRPTHHSRSRDGLTLDRDTQPAVYVNWYDAKAFCLWLNGKYASYLPARCAARLPTSEEWKALAGCGKDRTYPWGNAWPPAYGNYSDLAAKRHLPEWRGIEGYDDGSPVSCAVTNSGVNVWGLYGVGGNVWEWCEDWYSPARQFKVRHGGSWDFDDASTLRIETRGFDRPDARYDTIGFRIVLTPED